MKRPLSLNTQLTKLRIVNNLLKQTLPEAIRIKENGFTDTSRRDELKQVIYSLRDIQYMLRGLDYKAHRSSQTRKMTIFEIRSYLESIINSQAEPNQIYKQNIERAYIELGSVQQFLLLKKHAPAPAPTPTPTPTTIEEDELF